MARGTISGTTSSSYCVSEIEWESTTDVANNKSTVTARLYLKRTNSYTTYGSGWSFDISIGGITTTIKPGYTEVKTTKVLMGTATVTIPHNDDGSKSITISATGGCPGTSVTSINCSDTVALDNIPRASSITSVSDATLGGKCSVKWTPNAATFRYKLKFSIGGRSYTSDAIHPNTTSPYTYTGFTIPMDAAYEIPSGTTGTMTVTLYTYPDSTATTHTGSPSSKTFTVTVPPSALPTVSIDSVEPVNSLPSEFDGLYVQGYSKVKVTMSSETQYGADIQYYDFSVEGKTYGANDGYTSGYLINSGEVSVVGHAVDSRGYGGYTDAKINVIPYSRPKVQNVTVQRCDDECNPDDSGTYLTISAKRDYSKVEVDGKQKNYCIIRYRYKPEGGEYSDWITILTGDKTENEVSTLPLQGGDLRTDTTYHVQVGVKDSIGNESNTTVTIPTDKVYWHRDGARNALGLGKYNEKDNAIDSGWDMYMNGHKIIGLPEPTDDSEAVPKSYVDRADVRLTKNLDTMGWYKIGSVSGDMCAVVTFTIGGEYGNDDPSPSMVDIATQYNHSRAFLRLPAVADNQVSKIGLIQESASGCGVYLYYNSTMGNTVKVNIHTHMGNFVSGGLAVSNVSESSMIAVITLIE